MKMCLGEMWVFFRFFGGVLGLAFRVEVRIKWHWE